MVRLRARKVANIAQHIPLQEVEGPDGADLLLVSWGGTYGACRTAAARARAKGQSVAHCHLRYLNPLPRNLEEILRRHKRVMVAELNMGQLQSVLQARFLVPTIGFQKIQGRPFAVSELTEKIDEVLADR
jgi:2-oxoglutarate ferredoxin oxidoreductase subunit alpha